MTDDWKQKRLDDPRLDALIRYYEDASDRILTDLGQRECARARQLLAEDPSALIIGTIESDDARCDARYPQGCWHIRTREGLNLMADMSDWESARFLVDMAVRHMLGTKEHAITKARIIASLFMDSNGNNYSDAIEGQWFIPVQIFCVHAARSTNPEQAGIFRVENAIL